MNIRQELALLAADVERLRAALDQGGEMGGWRCFHCGEVFTDDAAAKEHFGSYEDCLPACKIGVEQYRKMEEELAAWRSETDHATREFYALGADHERKQRRVEEEGYERGLREAIPSVDECVKAALSARFGPPSFWGSDRPRGWHLDRPCTPAEASMHDNGCVDAAKAIRALQARRGSQ